jgi:hypothetical protein
MATTTKKIPKRMSSLYTRMKEANFAPKYVREVALPSWWDDALAETKTGYADAAFIIARHCGVSLADLLDDTAAITLEPLGKIRFKSNSVPEAMRSATSIAFRAAHLVLRAMTKPLRDSIPSNPEILR